MIIIIATLAQALSSSSPSVSIVGIIVFWRIIMVCIGSIRIVSDVANKDKRVSESAATILSLQLLPRSLPRRNGEAL